jgi:hypothetical protein
MTGWCNARILRVFWAVFQVYAAFAVLWCVPLREFDAHRIAYFFLWGLDCFPTVVALAANSVPNAVIMLGCVTSQGFRVYGVALWT